MKILFYIRTHFDDPNNSGVVQKYLALQKAAEFHGHTAHLLTFSEKGLCLNNQTWHSFPQRKHSWKHILFYYFFANRFLKNKLDFKDYHILYLRHLPAHEPR